MSLVTKNWKFCPVCAKALTTKNVEGVDKLACEGDHFLFYDNPLPVVAALIVGDEGVVLVKRGVAPFAGQWCLPRGFLNTDENPKQAVSREVREETGLHVWLKRILKQCNPSPANFALNQTTTFFLATVRGGKIEAGSDSVEARFFAFDQLPPLCFGSDKKMIEQWLAGVHGTVDLPVNFEQRSTRQL
jgi:ADP-ribose pyrophosphatase YjhB (NUDIX family)